MSKLLGPGSRPVARGVTAFGGDVELTLRLEGEKSLELVPRLFHDSWVHASIEYVHELGALPLGSNSLIHFKMLQLSSVEVN